MNEAQLSSCLRWLANFHARFVGVTPQGRWPPGVWPPGLWPVGTYWHLQTRPDEFTRMPTGALKDAASALDQKLSACRFRGLVHGDAKLANFCFGHGERGAAQVAAVDFQYVGGGCGMKDLVYFLGSAFTESECERHAPACVDLYFRHLRSALRALGKDELSDALEAEWRPLFAVAWADFHRFLLGWGSRHTTTHDYTKRLIADALAQLR